MQCMHADVSSVYADSVSVYCVCGLVCAYVSIEYAYAVHIEAYSHVQCMHRGCMCNIRVYHVYMQCKYIACMYSITIQCKHSCICA